jgi:uncharacterized membrane protein YphA (DoxX/SURF4 family)
MTAQTKISNRKARLMNCTLWIIQTLLALLFLFAGGVKLVVPIEALTQQMPLPGAFLRFIGVAEVFGAIGLILPWALRIRRELTPLAAFGLVLIMIGATVLTYQHGGASAAVMPFTVGVLLVLVGYGRWSRLTASPRQTISNLKVSLT